MEKRNEFSARMKYPDNGDVFIPPIALILPYFMETGSLQDGCATPNQSTFLGSTYSFLQTMRVGSGGIEIRTLLVIKATN